MFAFVVHPVFMPGNAKVFLHETISKIAGFEPEFLEKEIMVRQLFNMDVCLEDMEFHEIGEHMPITFEKQVSYTLNQK